LLTRLPLAALPLIVVALWSGPVRGQEQQTDVDKIIKLNKAALDDIDSLAWEGAKKKLVDALAVADRAGLDKHPVKARTYVHLGYVHITGFKNREQGERAFRHALEIQSDIRLTRALVTPEVAEIFGKAGGPPSRPTLDCPVPQQTRVDEAVPVRCALIASDLPVTKVFLLFRDPSKRRFIEAELKKIPDGSFQGQIPQRVIYGESVQVYFEGRNAAGKPIARNGGERSPNLIAIIKR
jgi:hypothetical protein